MPLDDLDSPMHQDGDVYDLVNSRLASIAHVTTHSSPSSIKHALDLLDDELDVLRNVLVSVAARRNAISQNSRLPPEILSRIFHFIADFHRAMDSNAYPNVGQRREWTGWLEVLHVCRRWRAVALLDLTLWTEITYTTNLLWLEHILVSLQGAPVKLHRYIQSNMRREFEVINDHLSHIKELVIIVDDEIAYFEMSHAFAPPSLSNPAPLLESVTFATRRNGEQFDVSDEELVTPLPLSLFGGEVPALRRIALRSYLPQHILSSPLITRSITHFELFFPRTPVGETQGTEDEPPERFYLEEPRRSHLLSCIGRMPNLEVLELVRCFPPPFATDPWPQNLTVHLPRLQHVVLSGSDTDCAAFLERAKMPPGVSLAMSCLFSSDMPVEGLATVQPIAAAIHGFTTSAASAHRITALAFQVSEHYPMLRMHAWRERAPGVDEDLPFFAVDFGTGLTSLEALCLPLLGLLSAAPHLADVRTLAVFSADMMHARSAWTGARLAQVLAQFPGAAHLVVNVRTAGLLPDALAVPGDACGQLTALSVLTRVVGLPSRRMNENSYIDRLVGPFVELKQRRGNLQTVCVPGGLVEVWRERVHGAVSVQPLSMEVQKYFRPYERTPF